MSKLGFDEEYYNDYIEKIMSRAQRLYEENSQLKRENEALKQIHEYDVNMIDDVKGECIKLYKRIEKATNKIDNMFNNCDEYTIIDDLIELDKILKGDENNDR